MKVRIYFNLHKRRFSVQSKQAKGWRLLTHTDCITIRDAEFKVSEAGRQRVIREKRKNVHAFVEGYAATRAEIETYVVGHDAPLVMDAVSYDPYKAGTFMQGEAPIHTAELVSLTVTHDVNGNRKPAINAI